MKAVVFHGIGDVRLEDVPEPRIQDPYDAIVRLTSSAICGTDLHMIRGSMPGMQSGTILGHEGVGVIEELGERVRNFSIGDRVVICSTIACGNCSYCRAGYYAQCDNANPNGKEAGTAFFGGPKSSGPFHGLQAEKARVPFAHVGMVKLPESVSDDQGILLSDIFPTGYFGADLAEISSGDTVAVLGCGPVGLCAVASARLMNAGRVLAVDQVPSRLDLARSLGAEVINFNEEDPVQMIKELTGGIGVDRLIDAVGIDAESAKGGPASEGAGKQAAQYRQEQKSVTSQGTPSDGSKWRKGAEAASQALEWGVESVAKAGTVAIIGVYPEMLHSFPIGMAMNKNLTINMGNCNHRKYVPMLVELVMSGMIDPLEILSQAEPLEAAIDAYEAFDQRRSGWIKTELIANPV